MPRSSRFDVYGVGAGVGPGGGV
ncbi:MAG: hypothetical protein K0S65_5502, partial [Labilithrix sp.]|nr:hypothetical protein [Labilithrix sp.]